MRSTNCALRVAFCVALIAALFAGDRFLNAQIAAPKQVANANTQAQALLSEAWQLEQARRPREAIAKAEQAVTVLRAAGGDASEPSLAALVWLADCCDRNEDFVKAQKIRSETLSASARLYGKGHWKVVDARLAMEDTKRL